MIKTFEIRAFDHHIIINDNGRTLLIDTGSQSTLFDGEEFEFLGKHVSKGILNLSPDIIGELLGTHIDALVGCDILKHFSLLIDSSQSSITFSDEELSLPDGESFPLSSKLGLPCMSLRLKGLDGNYFLDSGAKISYVKRNFVDGLTPEGQEDDFYTGFGHFETPVYRIPTNVGGHEFPVSYGTLPQILELSLLNLTGATGIIGHDLFQHFAVLLDLKNKTVQLRVLPICQNMLECQNYAKMSESDILA